MLLKISNHAYMDVPVYNLSIYVYSKYSKHTCMKARNDTRNLLHTHSCISLENPSTCHACLDTTYRDAGLEGGGERDLVAEHLTLGDVLGGKHHTLLRAALHHLSRACEVEVQAFEEKRLRLATYIDIKAQATFD